MFPLGTYLRKGCRKPIQNIPQWGRKYVLASSLYLHFRYRSFNTQFNRCFTNKIAVGVADYNQISCVLSNLKSDSYYQIDVLAVYGSNFKSKSSTVYVKTYKRDVPYATVQHENPQNIVTFLTTSSNTQLNLDNIKHRNTGGGGASALRSRSNTLRMGTNNVINEVVNGYATGTDNNDSHIENILQLRIKEIDNLKQVLEVGQDELKSVTDLQTKLEQEFLEKSDSLRIDRDRQRDIKKSGDRTRQSIRSEGKVLEDNTRYSKKDLKNMDLEMAKINAEINSKTLEMEIWEKDINNFQIQLKQIQQEGPKIKAEVESEIETLQKEVLAAQSQYVKLDENVKKLNMERRLKDKQREEFTQILKILDSSTKEDGLLNSEGNTALQKLSSLNPTIFGTIKNEIDIDGKSEAVWKADQSREVNNCTIAYSNFHAIKKRLEELTEKKVSRTLASINMTASEREKQQKQQQQQAQKQLQQLKVQQRQAQPFQDNSINNSSIYNSQNIENTTIPFTRSTGTNSLISPLLSSASNIQLSFSNSTTQLGTPSDSNILPYTTNSNAANGNIQNLRNNTFNLWNGIGNTSSTTNDAVGVQLPTPGLILNTNSTNNNNTINNFQENEKSIYSPSAETYLPKNLFDNGINENFIEDMRQYRYNFTENKDLPSSSMNVLSSTLTNMFDFQTSGLQSTQFSRDSNSFDGKPNVGISSVLLRSKLSHLEPASGRSSSSDAPSLADQRHELNKDFSNDLSLASRLNSIGSGESPNILSDSDDRQISHILDFNGDNTGNSSINNGNANGHSIASTFSPKKLFAFNRKQPSISSASGFNYATLVENGTEMVTNSVLPQHNNSDSIGSDNPDLSGITVESHGSNTSRFFSKKTMNTPDANLLDTKDMGLTNKGMSRFFNRKSSITATDIESPGIPLLSLTSPTNETGSLNFPISQSNTGRTSDDLAFNLADFGAPSSLKVRERSGSINSGVLIPQSFHTAQVNFGAVKNNVAQPTTNFWGQSNQSTNSLFYNSAIGLPTARGTSFEGERLFETTSHNSDLIDNEKTGNSWSLFHINKNNFSLSKHHGNGENNDNSSSGPTVESPFLDGAELNNNGSKSNPSRMLFFRSKDKEKDKEKEKEKTGIHHSGAAVSAFETVPQAPPPTSAGLELNENTLSVQSPAQNKKRKSIFSFAKSNNVKGEVQNSEAINTLGSSSPTRPVHSSAAASLSETTNTLSTNDFSENEHFEEEENVTPTQEKPSKATKLLPKSMRNLGISRRSSATSSGASATQQPTPIGGSSNSNETNDNGSVSTSAKSFQNESIGVITE